MKKLLILSLFLFVGCESSQDMFKNQTDDGEVVIAGIHCEMMSRTGSNRKTKVCRTTEQMEKDKKEAYTSLNRKQRTGYTTGN
ncbi:hypothetical protein [Shewanella pneumatophori]|uniref:Lipoprotein n=1 Tax=Shewanella pneumatophori TaxID=314092 RepID=A0A9X1ZCQ2_9GAMM|nr:hypothetical protein [Shewanella pneumatophori]MCL1139136.1 hypothetical protein [Shewanella pneumatophori]